MAYEVEKKDTFLEVRVSGDTSKDELIEAIRELRRCDPRKELPDLWLFAGECQVPLVEFSDIAQAVLGLLPRNAVGNKTAIVAANEFRMAQIDMYRFEAAVLPFAIRVFRSRDEAVAWFTTSDGPASPPG